MQQEISLYIDLEPSKNVDLEAAARAAIAFNSFIKEVAFAVDPALIPKNWTVYNWSFPR